MDIIVNLPNEEWKEIQGYPKYFVSNMGRIASLKNLKPRILATFINNKGYERVALSKNGQSHHYLVSRLVAEAFCPNSDPEGARTVDHIDGDKENNEAANLRWMSQADNVRECFRRRREKNDTSRISEQKAS